MLKKECKAYIENNINRKLTDTEIKKIETHMRRFNVEEVCAWYSDWKDFCSDWCDGLEYTRKQARERLHGGIGEFQKIKTLGIIRFTL